MIPEAAVHRTKPEPCTHPRNALRMRLRRVSIAATTTILALAACEADEPPRRQLRTPAAEVQAPPAPYTPTHPIVVTLDEWQVYTDPYDVREGRHEFLVINDGLTRHALVVEGGGKAWRTPLISPGDQATLVVDLQPGRYELYCPVEDEHGDHSEMGMRTTLEVGGM